MREKFLAALMLIGANHDKYGELKSSMAENYVMGTREYPESPEVVLRILNGYVPPVGWNRHIKQDAPNLSDEGAMFAQSGGDDSWKANIPCHGCGKQGHLKRECPNKKGGQRPNDTKRQRASCAGSGEIRDGARTNQCM